MGKVIRVSIDFKPKECVDLKRLTHYAIYDEMHFCETDNTYIFINRNKGVRYIVAREHINTMTIEDLEAYQ